MITNSLYTEAVELFKDDGLGKDVRIKRVSTNIIQIQFDSNVSLQDMRKVMLLIEGHESESVNVDMDIHSAIGSNKIIIEITKSKRI